jgi:hypothetical protein
VIPSDLSETHSRQTSTPADRISVTIQSLAHEMSTALKIVYS